ncbi:MAG: LPS-assembly lipoprotein LptE [Achromobacter mucicolens]|uniref:LPS-assembly lipoprotein LptE n=1 Tax=Achromobacter mucicolens TaxID=1389922 RepID=A0ABM8LLI4_9BURK|nr:LPS assembly lipoprotein LptE [Achromobacter mucicolens]MCP2518145.1 LPS assembly lipoprotein LptE [Achromobacter mucicolens]MCU6619246.1 LPS assembly lipoprotein LptE [Achromobacter mucicolens]CAB3921504.1 LPS-assembly lipoprotein LptE [Achromobacter mucicolens]
MHFAGQQSQVSRQTWLLRGACLALFMLLSACGFALRGTTPMPFDTLYVGIPDNIQFGADLRRALRAASPNTKLVDSRKEAQAILQQVNDTRTLREVSLNAQGRVESYELGINYTFRLIDAKGRALVPDTTLSIYREMPYDDQVVQAKQGQIETLYKAMQRDLVSRVLRRITAPDVHKAFEAAQAGGDDANTPLFDPNEQQRPRVPTPWQTPSVTDPAIVR